MYIYKSPPPLSPPSPIHSNSIVHHGHSYGDVEVVVNGGDYGKDDYSDDCDSDYGVDANDGDDDNDNIS